MTIGTRTAGAWGSGSTSVTPALPASSAAGDMMVLFVGCKPFGATIVQPTGWTEIAAAGGNNGSTGSGIDSGSVAWKHFYREFVAGDAAPVVSITSGNVSLAVINGFTKTAGAWVTPVGDKGSDTSSDTAFSLTMASDIGIAANDSLLSGAVIAGNNATFGTPTCTAAGATISTPTESPATEGTTATGNDLEASAFFTTCTAGTSSAAAVVGWTLSVAQTGGGGLVRLREDFNQALTPGLFSNSQSFFAPTVTATYTLTPGLFSNVNQFYAATVTHGSLQELTPGLFTNSNSFYAAAVAATYSLTPALFANGQTFYSATVTPGVVTLTPGLLTNANAFFAPTVTPGAVALTPALFSNSQTFYAPAVTATYTLTPGLFSNAQTFFAPTVTPGVVTLTPGLLTNANSFYSAMVTGVQQLLPLLLENVNQFHAATLTPGAVTLTPGLLANGQVFYGVALVAYSTTPSVLIGVAEPMTYAVSVRDDLNLGVLVSSIVLGVVAAELEDADASVT